MSLPAEFLLINPIAPKMQSEDLIWIHPFPPHCKDCLEPLPFEPSDAVVVGPMQTTEAFWNCPSCGAVSKQWEAEDAAHWASEEGAEAECEIL